MEEILEKIIKGEIKLHEIENIVQDKALAIELRRKAIEKLTGKQLKHISSHSINLVGLIGRNIDNPIGIVQIPMGIVCPLRVKGNYADGDFFIPLCTTEGALVASINRGATTITLAGGAHSVILRDKMTRAPVLKTPTAEHAKKVIEWLNQNFEKLKEATKKVTKHGELISVEPYVVGRNVFLRFAFDTKDAMGMNMATIATDEALKILENELDFVQHIALSGNLCVDKKAAAINLVTGRGKTVVSEMIVPRDIVDKELKTTPEAIVEVNYRKNLVGSAQAGSLGFNAHFANIVAAIFLACGQDAAHVVEGSLGITTAELTENKDLYCAVTLPCLQVGTVGGGTRVESQREALELLGVAGGGNPPGTNAKKFAEIVAAAVLAGELSLLGALAARHLAQAHAKLGR